MTVFQPPAFPPPAAPTAVPPARRSTPVFWVAVAVLALAAGAGAWSLARPDAAAQPGPDPALHTVESRPIEAHAGAGGPITAATLAPSDPQAVAPAALDTVPTTSAPPLTGRRCTSPFGWTLTVPDGWFESGCQLFAPYPITETDPTLSDAPVQVLSLDGTWDEVIVVATPEDRAVVGQGEAVVAGRRALVVSSVQTEPGWYDVGVAVYEIWVDDGGRVVILTAWAADGDLSPLVPVVDALAASLEL